METNTSNTDAPVQAFIERNGTSIGFSPTEITRGKNSGQCYPCPNLKAEPMDKIIAFFGEEWIKERLMANYRQQCQGYYEAASASGEFSMTEFTRCVQSAAVIRKTKAELVDELQEQISLLKAFNRPDLSTSEQVELQRIIAAIKFLSDEIEKRKRTVTQED